MCTYTFIANANNWESISFKRSPYLAEMAVVWPNNLNIGFAKGTKSTIQVLYYNLVKNKSEHIPSQKTYIYIYIYIYIPNKFNAYNTREALTRNWPNNRPNFLLDQVGPVKFISSYHFPLAEVKYSQTSIFLGRQRKVVG